MAFKGVPCGMRVDCLVNYNFKHVCVNNGDE